MIDEPMTLATDYLLSAVATWFAIRLAALARARSWAGAPLWSFAFLATAAGAFFGGTYHGFRHLLAPLAAQALWKATVYAVGLAALFLLLASARDLTRSAIARRALQIFALAEFALYAVWMTAHDGFQYVIVDYGSALVILAFLAIPAAPWIVGSVATSVVAAVIQQSGYALHRHFNHNDLYHLVQIAALWMLYRGAADLTTTSTVRSTIQPT